MKAVGIWVVAIMAFLGVGGLVMACSHDEPSEENKTNHRTDPTPSVEEQPTELSPIVGSWLEAELGITHSFDEEGGYRTSDAEGNIMLNGSYYYDGVTSMLRISIDSESDTRLTTYRCIIAADTLTLYEQDGRKHELVRCM